MPVEPLDWVTWREARSLIRTIWDGWYREEVAGQAMMASLRRGNFDCRGQAWDADSRRPVALRDVMTGLLRLRHDWSGDRAEYEVHGFEATQSGSVLPPGWNPQLPLSTTIQMRPTTFTKTAILEDLKLPWNQLYDDLVRYGLPAGVTPKPAPRQHRRTVQESADEQPSEPRPKPTTAREIADWVFARHQPEARNLFDERFQQAREDPSLTKITRQKMTEAYQTVYVTASHPPPKAGWPLQPAYQERWEKKQRK